MRINKNRVRLNTTKSILCQMKMPSVVDTADCLHVKYCHNKLAVVVE